MESRNQGDETAPPVSEETAEENLNDLTDAERIEEEDDDSDTGDINPSLAMATAPLGDDEMAVVTQLLRQVELKEDREAIVEALKGFLRDPVLSAEAKKIIDLYEDAKKSGDDSKAIFGKDVKMANKFVSNLPKFGLNKEYTWPEMVANLEMIQSTGIYPDSEMKLMLWGTLEGTASEYVRAHPEIFTGTFGGALAKLSAVFGKTVKICKN